MIFKDRTEAGKQLGERLGNYRNKPEVLVLGLPGGGIVVAREVARALRCPLDILIVRKIRFPGKPELAVGAISETGPRVLNQEIITGYAVTGEYLERESVRQKEEIERRINLYRGGRGMTSVSGKTVILVDEGVATGASIKVAIWSLKRESTARLVVALPVASQEAQRELAEAADELLCLQAPAHFTAVRDFYLDFAPVNDDEVAVILKSMKE